MTKNFHIFLRNKSIILPFNRVETGRKRSDA